MKTFQNFCKIFHLIVIASVLLCCKSINSEEQGSNSVCQRDYEIIKAREMDEIEIGYRAYKRFVLENLAEEDLRETEVSSLERMEVILESRARPVDAKDLAILDGAENRLIDQSFWDRADDRKCDASDNTFSLYCALYFASVEVVGEYQHRRTVMQEVRFAIEDVSDGREFEHRLMDYNNHPDTTFEDISHLLETTKSDIESRLELQAKCSL